MGILGRSKLSERRLGVPHSADPVGVIWRGLRQPWLLLILGMITLLLILVALVLPQVPQELASDGPATSRWLLSVSADYGNLGDAIQNLGLFDVLHSLLLRTLFGLIGLVIAVHLADLTAAALHFRNLTRILQQPTGDIEEPLISSSSNPLYRSRVSVTDSVEIATARVESYLQAAFSNVTRIQIPLEKPPNETDEEAGTLIQERMLALRSPRATYLRPLLMLGLLTALVPVWMIIIFGWELYPRPLAPGATIHFEAQDVSFVYAVQKDEAQEASAQSNGAESSDVVERGPELQIQVRDETAYLPISSHMSLRVNQVDITARPGPPGLLIGLAGLQENLVLPGQSQLMKKVGLVFPGAGNEETILMPLQFSALRIVRSDIEGRPNYVVQVLNRDEDAVGTPVYVDGQRASTVAIETLGQTLLFEPMPSLIVEARYLPGAWLLLIALGLVIIGAISYWLRTGYLLLQLAPWPAERAIAIAQSDLRSEVEAIEQLLANG